MGSFSTNSGTIATGYLTFVARALTAVNILYVLADDLHRANVDPNFPVAIEEAFALWRHRELMMCSYIDGLPLDATTVECVDDDGFLDLPDASDLFEGLLDSGALIAAVNEDERRFLRVVDFGFAKGGSFENVIQGTRVQWVLERELSDRQTV